MPLGTMLWRRLIQGLAALNFAFLGPALSGAFGELKVPGGILTSFVCVGWCLGVGEKACGRWVLGRPPLAPFLRLALVNLEVPSGMSFLQRWLTVESALPLDNVLPCGILYSSGNRFHLNTFHS